MATATLEREKVAPEELVSSRSGENTGLQARLIIGGTLLDHNQRFKNPKQRFKDEVTPEHLEIKPHIYQPLQKLSDLERKAAWKGKEDDVFQRQKDAWAQKIVEVMEKKQAFFQTDSRGRKWKELYGMLDINVDGFNQDSANILYDRFFGGDRKGQEVERFVGDVLDLDIYKDPSEDNHLNFAKVEADLDAYTWLGHIFGGGTSVVTTELIAAHARVKDKTQKTAFIKELNQKEGGILEMVRPDKERKSRINNLTEFERDLLDYIHTAATKGELKLSSILKKLIGSAHIGVLPSMPEVLPAAPLSLEHSANSTETPIDLSPVATNRSAPASARTEDVLGSPLNSRASAYSIDGPEAEFEMHLKAQSQLERLREKLVNLPIESGDRASCAIDPEELLALLKGLKYEDGRTLAVDQVSIAGSKLSIKGVIKSPWDKRKTKELITNYAADFDNKKSLVKLTADEGSIAVQEMSRARQQNKQAREDRAKKTVEGLGNTVEYLLGKFLEMHGIDWRTDGLEVGYDGDLTLNLKKSF